MLDIEGNRVFDEANGLYRIAVLRVGAIYIDTRFEVVRLGPLRLDVTVCEYAIGGKRGLEHKPSGCTS